MSRQTKSAVDFVPTVLVVQLPWVMSPNKHRQILRHTHTEEEEDDDDEKNKQNKEEEQKRSLLQHCDSSRQNV